MVGNKHAPFLAPSVNGEVRQTQTVYRLTWGVCKDQAGISKARMCFFHVVIDKVCMSLKAFRFQAQ